MDILQNENIILALVNKVPVWFIETVICLFLLHFFCSKNLKLITKILLKHRAREDKKDKEQDTKIIELESGQRVIVANVREIKNTQEQILELLTKPKEVKNDKA
jgi:hypothetical protein